MTVDFAIIGGSGFYEIKKSFQKKTIETPFGKVDVFFTEIGEKEVVFLPRHGTKHETPPHMINYRANIYAMHLLEVRRIIATSAVGSMKKSIAPGDLIIPDQFIDFTSNRPKTFFDGLLRVTLSSGKELKGVVHRDVSEPYCSDVRKELFTNSKKENVQIHNKGVYVCTNGPRFETPAEINAYKILGGTIVGMTALPEIALARELDICYGSLCLVTNYAAGMQGKITIEEVLTLFEKKIEKVRTIIFNTISALQKKEEICSCNE